ncbi:MAG: cysteine desulfurase [Bacteroidota bacterium]
MPSLPLSPSEVPLLDVPEGERPCYLDSAATSLKPKAVVDRIARFYAFENAPVHRGVYELSARATDLYEQARRTVGAFVGASAESVVFTRGTTEGLNLVARSWGEERVGPGDEILLSPQEHHSNFLPWQELAKRTGATLGFLPLQADGTIDADASLDLIGPATKLVAMTHVSNVLGIENPVREVFAAAQSVGALTVLDGAQSVPTRPVDLADLHCDALTFGAHKMLGPTGIGALVARPEVLEAMTVYQTGGGMIRTVAVEGSDYLDGYLRFEAGTPHAAGAVGFAAACDYLTSLSYEDETGMAAVAAYERAWGRYATRQIRAIPGVRLIGPPGEHEAEGGIVALQLEGLHPHDLAVLLDAQGVMCRAGHHCTMPLHAHLAGGGAYPATSLRASAYVYNPLADADRLAEALQVAHETLTRRRTVSAG